MKIILFKTHKTRSIYFIIFSVIAASLLIQAGTKPENKSVLYYKKTLENLQKDLNQLYSLCLKKEQKTVLQNQFRKTRLAFKKAAVFTDYYNFYETRQMNGAALPRMEEDKPEIIFEPGGFQVIEEIIFSNKSRTDYKKIGAEIKTITGIIKMLQQDPNIEQSLQPMLLTDALQSSLIRLITLGISGFDSPVALHSLPEAKATLESIKEIFKSLNENQYKLNATEKDTIIQQISKSIQFLGNRTDFNNFDRLTFIRQYINPLYKSVVNYRNKNNFWEESSRRPLNKFATSLFDSNAFNIDFFSPNERFRVTPERVVLGKKLFYDPILSATRKRTCATCHKPELAFTDALPKALSVDEKTYLLRNTPTLWFSALQTRQFFDSRTSKLENQLNDVVHNQEEMKGSLEQSVIDLGNDNNYVELFKNAYPDEKEKITPYSISNAISSYMRTLISYDSRFDKFMHGDNKALNQAEKKGFNLFMGKGKCGTCHFMPLFNGLVPPLFTETESEVLGVPKTTAKKPAILDDDLGKIKYSKSSIHKYAFKTPTLRNIEMTAPYMHNGVYKTLEEVMEFYNNGGGAGLGIAPENQTLPPDKLNLTNEEISSIIQFLKTLSDNNLKKH